jgi:hypothetical protein
MAMDKHGYLPTASNLNIALSEPDFIDLDVRWDDVKHEKVISPRGDVAWRRFEERDYFNIQLRLERKGFKPIRRQLLRDAINHHAREQASIINFGRQDQRGSAMGG